MNTTEKTLLGAIVNFWDKDQNKIISAIAKLKHEYFTCEDGANLFIATLHCIENRMAPDIAALSNYLNGTPNVSHGSWLAQIRELMNFATSSAGVVELANVVKADYDAKKALVLFNQSVLELSNDVMPPRERIKKAMEVVSVIDITDDAVKSAYTMEEALGQFMDMLDQPERTKGISTGFEHFDGAIQGLQNGNTYPLAGSPGAGKTTMALNWAHSALMNNKNVLFYSLEMPASEIITKLVSLNSKITSGFLRGGDIADDDTNRRLEATFAQLLTKNLIIDEGIGMTAENLDITTKKNELKLGGIDLIVLDYLTLLPAQGESETVKATNAAKALKMISKKYNCPVVILSQFVKNLLGRPKKSDLRQTGQLEQDASAIFLLYKDPEIETNVIECDIAKNRWGSTGVKYFESDFPRNSFKEIEEPAYVREQQEKSKPSSMMNWGKK